MYAGPATAIYLRTCLMCIATAVPLVQHPLTGPGSRAERAWPVRQLATNRDYAQQALLQMV